MKRSVPLFVLGFYAAAAGAVDTISLQALFKDKAVFLVDGARRVLASGQTSPEGVRLLSTDTVAEQAEVEINGKREVVKLSVVMAGFKPVKEASVTLWAEPNGHFFADGAINGQPVRFLVDTGATTIALSSADATRLGIDYRRIGHPGFASTASGVVRSYRLTLAKVEIGPITLFDVDAGVVEGAYPSEPLLGMSFLGRLEMKREGNRMELVQH